MRIIQFLKVLYHLPKTVYFNFHYLPFYQAIKIPIVFVSNVQLVHTEGSVVIEGHVRPGMVIMGGNGNVLYRQATHSCVWSNYGGKCIFSDSVDLSIGVAIEIGKHGVLTFGENIRVEPMGRIACHDSLEIGSNTRISWESIILDTDFHSTINTKTGERSVMTKAVKIGRNNWIGIRCLILKGTLTPDFCTISAYSLLNKRYDIPNYSLIGGIPAKFLKEGLYRDLYSHVNETIQQQYNKKISSGEQ